MLVFFWYIKIFRSHAKEGFLGILYEMVNKKTKKSVVISTLDAVCKLHQRIAASDEHVALKWFQRGLDANKMAR